MKQADIEKSVLKYWEQDNTFKKSIKKPSPKGDYVFYDGPPFATGTPHYGHIVASLMKDIVPRYWTMRGYRVERRWGWDCHGLPIENIVEKEKGFKHKKDILEYGVDTFNEDARSRVLQYADQWRDVIVRMGRWVDFDDDYKTMDPEFMESVWWAFKELYDKGLLYEAYRSMHICPRCETTLAQSEVAQGYKDVKDLSVTVKFKIRGDANDANDARITQMLTRHPERSADRGNGQAESKDLAENPIYLLAWTTTPWTLPGNMALALGENIAYVAVTLIRHPERSVRAESKDPVNALRRSQRDSSASPQNDVYIIAKDRVEEVFKDKEFEVVSEVKGKELVGLKYEPLFPYYDNDQLKGRENAFKVYAGNDFVNTEEGTGIVHIAPAFGADDYGLSNQEQIPFVQHVNMDGTFKKEVTDFAGEEVKPKDDPSATDVKIIQYLAKCGLLFSKEKIEHSYPHCWRCDSPLLNYSTSSWFVAVEKIKDDLLKNATSISWMPAHIKDGRFGQWLEGARDWSISRQRFWGSVLPIWRCSSEKHQTSNIKHQKNTTYQASKECGHTMVIGSIQELEKLSGKKVADLHKHFVDKIVFECPKCQGEMRRVPDVLDCWFESGSMPYGQMHYPFENEKKFEKNFPAEFIAEGVDQTRAWFYYLHVLSTALQNKPAFKNVIVNGIVLAQDGKKMSKRLQNYPDPMEMFEKYGADAVRYYLATAAVMRAEDMRFSEKEVDEVVKKVLLILYNVLSFYKMYCDKNDANSHANDTNKKPSHDLDRWIIARIGQLTKDSTEAYDSYDLNRATRPIMNFVNDLSTWYLRRSRDRIKHVKELDDYEAITTLRFTLERLTLLIAPAMPFTAEYIWQEIGNEESVHLQEWPELGEVDINILERMDKIRKICEMGNAARAQAGIKVRQPLASATLSKEDGGLDSDDELLIQDELNVRDVLYSDKVKSGELKLDTKVTDELRLEGHLRELVRTINVMRKKQGLTPGDVVMLAYKTDSDELKKVFDTYSPELKKSVIASTLTEKENGGEVIKVNNEEIKIDISRKT